MANKLKTNKAMAKRVKITKRWKIIHVKCGKSHLLTNKGKAPKRYKYGKVLSEKEAAKVKALLPYK